MDDERLHAAAAVAAAALADAAPAPRPESIDPEATRLHVSRQGGRPITRTADSRLLPEWDDDLIGRKLAQYRILEDLGRGSMARVFKAWHLGLERTCALKIIDPNLVARRPILKDQFWAEARAAAESLLAG